MPVDETGFRLGEEVTMKESNLPAPVFRTLKSSGPGRVRDSGRGCIFKQAAGF